MDSHATRKVTTSARGQHGEAGEQGEVVGGQVQPGPAARLRGSGGRTRRSPRRRAPSSAAKTPARLVACSCSDPDRRRIRPGGADSGALPQETGADAPPASAAAPPSPDSAQHARIRRGRRPAASAAAAASPQPRRPA